MAPQAPREQEQSIKARKREIFEEEQSFGPRKPFADYLARTEATPLSTGQKAVLWGVGALVVLLLLAALLTMPAPTSGPHQSSPAKGAAAPAAGR
ncbi:hypothetical protein SAMN05444166_3631 [Singulisphaera sp. GP187]|uniref:hypothetical protein n=1 Tax=Singulisphaera sp. GP187 TaxID=1882752 RepID=UPI000927D546|nr:hypothetical protein [Singulisphaera sp. GP187]SIO30430.1 hypothetical protein SAMN05444166_3631 [Singulisphaera sp. GP187]